MDHRKQTKTRFAIAALTGIVIIGICLNVTWNDAGVYIQFPQMFTRRTLKYTALAVEEYRQKKGTLPRSLSQLNGMSDAPIIQDNGVIWDSWRHPLIYKVHKDNFTLMSYGRDGKPGGIGLDCDLSSANPKPATAALPFLQVIFHPLARGMVWTSVISGVLTFLLIFSVVTPIDLSQQRWRELAFKLLFTLIATYFVAVFITMLHVPSGH
jgi:general secretion pathway protein G